MSDMSSAESLGRSHGARQIGINELRALQRLAQQFMHFWDDYQSTPRQRKSRASMNVAIALTLLRDGCKALGLLDTELSIHGQRSNFDLVQLLIGLREAIGAMCAKLRLSQSIGVDVNKYPAFDLRNPSFKPPTAKDWNKAVRLASVKGGWNLDTKSVSFKREWIDAVRNAAERLPKAPPGAEEKKDVSPPTPTDATAKTGDGHGAAAFTIDRQDEEILKALAKHFPRRRSHDEMADDSNVSKKTVGQRVRDLLKAGLVNQPKGPKNGTSITDAGMKLLNQLAKTDAKLTR